MSPSVPTRASARKYARLRQRVQRTALAGSAAVALVAGVVFAGPALARPSESSGIFSDRLTPAVAVDPDRVPVELGLRFSPQKSGTVTAVQYYQGGGLSGVTSASLWSADGRRLTQVSFSAARASGWQTVALPEPVAVTAGSMYTVSYHAARGGYPVTERDLDTKRAQNGFTLPRNAGVYRYGHSHFPTRTYEASNYFVDVVFEPESDSRPGRPAATPSATPTAKPTTAPTPKPTAPPTTPSTPTPAPSTPAPAPSTPAPATSPTASPTQPARPTSPVPTPTTPASGAGWSVTPTTVGLAPLGLSCDALPAYTGSSTVPRGTVISGKLITTPLNLSAGGITIERSCIRPTTAWRGLPILSTMDNNTLAIASTKVTVRDSEISGERLSTEDAAWATGFMGVGDLVSNYFHDLGSGIAVMHSGNTEDMLIERNYVTRLIAWGNPATTGNHTDAFTIRDFSASQRPDRQLVIRNNRFDAHSGNDTGALFIQTYAGRIDNVTIQGNLLEGLGYQLGLNELNSPYSNLRAIDNRFSGTGFGATYVQRGPGWAQWQDNYLYKPAATDARGSVVRQP